MNKAVKIEFTETNSAVNASVKVEYQMSSEESEKYLNDEILKESTELFDKANAYASLKTMRKIK
jgi:hypothetical protein